MAAASPESIRKATEKVLSSSDYLLEYEENALAPFWKRVWQILIEFLEMVRQFFSVIHGLPLFIQWVIISSLFVLLIVLIAHILFSMVRAMGPQRDQNASLGYRPEKKDDPRVWEEQAKQLAASGSLIEAIRLLLHASLFRLEDSFDRPFRRSTTNREYLRKYRKLPILNEVKLLVETIDRKWYGEEVCEQQDYERCREAHATIVEMIRLHGRGPREAT